ncbi:hypothetical protein AVEN_71199-1 [Araneus ventricosus]|uniref:DUF4817 domain-containing protein n=1 Tax=Araneus ventricosus TaxID=182803 RepID=A0A4Y2HR62_ARAVE|nr:hypothetical protein AVEN_71199-1 [Araneus ventricosus]
MFFIAVCDAHVAILQPGGVFRRDGGHLLPYSRPKTTYKKDPPSDNSIRRWLTQFQETGSVLHRKGAGRPNTSQENVDRIQETFTRSPRKSTRQAAVQLHMPHTTIWNVLHNRLHLNAYKVQIVQALHPNDKPRRFEYCQEHCVQDPCTLP